MLRLTRFSYSKLFKILKERNMDDWQFSFEVGADPSILMRMLHNQSVPTAALNRICDCLGVSLGDIMDHEELQYPNGVALCDFIRDQAFWSDLEDTILLEVVFIFHEANELDKIKNLRFIIENAPQKIDDIMAQVAANIDMNPETNKYSSWIVTDRKLDTLNSFNGIDQNHKDEIMLGGNVRCYNLRTAFSLQVDVTDPELLKQGESE